MALMMRMEPQLNLRQEARLELEARIEQIVEQRLESSMRLDLYLEKEDFFKSLIRWVDKNNRWKKYNKGGFNFTYGLVPYAKVKAVADKYGAGFSHCFYDTFKSLFGMFQKGDWTLFVVEGMPLTENNEEDIALHERGEELSLGNHFFASKLEFAGVSRKREVRKYAKLIDEYNPTKFVDLTEKVLFPILPKELRAYLAEQDRQYGKEITIAEEMIEKYPLPVSVMKLVIKYDDMNKEAEEHLKNFLAPCQRAVYNNAKKPEQALVSMDQILSERIMAIPEENIRALVPRRMESVISHQLRELSIFFQKVTSSNIDVSYDLFKLYDNVKNKKPLFTLQ